MKYIDLFGGIGGFRYGIRQATKDNSQGRTDNAKGVDDNRNK